MMRVMNLGCRYRGRIVCATTKSETLLWAMDPSVDSDRHYLIPLQIKLTLQAHVKSVDIKSVDISAARSMKARFKSDKFSTGRSLMNLHALIQKTTKHHIRN